MAYFMRMRCLKGLCYIKRGRTPTARCISRDELDGASNGLCDLLLITVRASIGTTCFLGRRIFYTIFISLLKLFLHFFFIYKSKIGLLIQWLVTVTAGVKDKISMDVYPVSRCFCIQKNIKLADPANFLPPNFSFVNVFQITEKNVLVNMPASPFHVQCTNVNREITFPRV